MPAGSGKGAATTACRWIVLVAVVVVRRFDGYDVFFFLMFQLLSTLLNFYNRSGFFSCKKNK
jgi:hypothetical protein